MAQASKESGITESQTAEQSFTHSSSTGTGSGTADTPNNPFSKGSNPTTGDATGFGGNPTPADTSNGLDGFKGKTATTPDTTTPDSATPDSTTPDSTTPDSTTPDSTAPDSTTPDSTTPDSTTPDNTTPDSTTPDNTTPTPDSTSPDSTTPDSDTPKPDTTNPDTTKPDTTAPDTSKPDPSTPDKTDSSDPDTKAGGSGDDTSGDDTGKDGPIADSGTKSDTSDTTGKDKLQNTFENDPRPFAKLIAYTDGDQLMINGRPLQCSLAAIAARDLHRRADGCGGSWLSGFDSLSDPDKLKITQWTSDPSHRSLILWQLEAYEKTVAENAAGAAYHWSLQFQPGNWFSAKVQLVREPGAMLDPEPPAVELKDEGTPNGQGVYEYLDSNGLPQKTTDPKVAATAIETKYRSNGILKSAAYDPDSTAVDVSSVWDRQVQLNKNLAAARKNEIAYYDPKTNTFEYEKGDPTLAAAYDKAMIPLRQAQSKFGLAEEASVVKDKNEAFAKNQPIVQKAEAQTQTRNAFVAERNRLVQEWNDNYAPGKKRPADMDKKVFQTNKDNLNIQIKEYEKMVGTLQSDLQTSQSAVTAAKAEMRGAQDKMETYLNKLQKDLISSAAEREKLVDQIRQQYPNWDPPPMADEGTEDFVFDPSMESVQVRTDRPPFRREVDIPSEPVRVSDGVYEWSNANGRTEKTSLASAVAGIQKKYIKQGRKLQIQLVDGAVVKKTWTQATSDLEAEAKKLYPDKEVEIYHDPETNVLKMEPKVDYDYNLRKTALEKQNTEFAAANEDGRWVFNDATKKDFWAATPKEAVDWTNVKLAEEGQNVLAEWDTKTNQVVTHAENDLVKLAVARNTIYQTDREYSGMYSYVIKSKDANDKWVSRIFDKPRAVAQRDINYNNFIHKDFRLAHINDDGTITYTKPTQKQLPSLVSEFNARSAVAKNPRILKLSGSEGRYTLSRVKLDTNGVDQAYKQYLAERKETTNDAGKVVSIDQAVKEKQDLLLKSGSSEDAVWNSKTQQIDVVARDADPKVAMKKALDAWNAKLKGTGKYVISTKDGDKTVLRKMSVNKAETELNKAFAANPANAGKNVIVDPSTYKLSFDTPPNNAALLNKYYKSQNLDNIAYVDSDGKMIKSTWQDARSKQPTSPGKTWVVDPDTYKLVEEPTDDAVRTLYNSYGTSATKQVANLRRVAAGDQQDVWSIESTIQANQEKIVSARRALRRATDDPDKYNALQDSIDEATAANQREAVLLKAAKAQLEKSTEAVHSYDPLTPWQDANGEIHIDKRSVATQKLTADLRNSGNADDVIQYDTNSRSWVKSNAEDTLQAQNAKLKTTDPGQVAYLDKNGVIQVGSVDKALAAVNQYIADEGSYSTMVYDSTTNMLVEKRKLQLMGTMNEGYAGGAEEKIAYIKPSSKVTGPDDLSGVMAHGSWNEALDEWNDYLYDQYLKELGDYRKEIESQWFKAANTKYGWLEMPETSYPVRKIAYVGFNPETGEYEIMLADSAAAAKEGFDQTYAAIGSHQEAKFNLNNGQWSTEDLTTEEALKRTQDYFDQYMPSRQPVLGDDGQPVLVNGNIKIERVILPPAANIAPLHIPDYLQPTSLRGPLAAAIGTTLTIAGATVLQDCASCRDWLQRIIDSAGTSNATAVELALKSSNISSGAKAELVRLTDLLDAYASISNETTLAEAETALAGLNTTNMTLAQLDSAAGMLNATSDVKAEISGIEDFWKQYGAFINDTGAAAILNNTNLTAWTAALGLNTTAANNTSSLLPLEGFQNSLSQSSPTVGELHEPADPKVSFNGTTSANITAPLSNSTASVNGSSLPAKVTAPTNVTTVANGTMPASGTVPVNTTTALNGTIPGNVTPPTNVTTGINATIPVDGTLPANGTVAVNTTDSVNATVSVGTTITDNSTSASNTSTPTNGNVQSNNTVPVNGTAPNSGPVSANGTLSSDGSTLANGSIPAGNITSSQISTMPSSSTASLSPSASTNSSVVSSMSTTASANSTTTISVSQISNTTTASSSTTSGQTSSASHVTQSSRTSISSSTSM